MELNGVANILLILTEAKEDGKIDPQIQERIKKQCDLLERYMVAIDDYRMGYRDYPHWHEVKANPDQFPALKEKYASNRNG